MGKYVSASVIEQLIDLCCITSEPRGIGEPFNKDILSLSVFNGLGAWCYFQHKKGMIEGVDKQMLSTWKSVYFVNTLQYQKYLSAYKKASDILYSAGIPVVILKGLALSSNLYVDEGLRPMGDVDILVPEGMGSKALDVLLQSGAEQLVVPRSSYHEQADAHVRAIKIDGVMLEVHQRLFALGSSYHTPGVDFFKHTIEIEKQGVKMQQLNLLWMAYHLIAHAIKGVEMGGLRFGWLLDIALLLNQSDDLQKLINGVVEIRPKKKKQMMNVVNMALLLLPEEKTIGNSERKELVRQIAKLLRGEDGAREHRFINLGHLIKTPGLKNKVMLLLYEFFPQKEYMMYRYASLNITSLWRLYCKRMLRF